MTLLQSFSEDLRALVAQVAPAVVGVQHSRGQGSGFFITPDGFVLTNQHVVKGVRRAEVRLAGGETLSAEVVGQDAPTDLAVLRAPAQDLKSLPLAFDVPLEVGSLVVAIGNPYRFEGSVSLGVVSALGRTLPAPGGRPLENLVQTDAAINPGNSGGPLVDPWGRSVGVTTAMVPFAQGIGFAVPAATAHWVAALLIQRGSIERPYLGLAGRAEALPAALAQALGQPRAVRVVSVESGTPAARAGVQPGDLLLSVQGERLASVDDLQRLLVYAAGEVALGLYRRGAQRTLTPSRRPPVAPPRAAQGARTLN